MSYPITLAKPTTNARVARYALVVFGICASTSTASAEGFDTFGDQQRLENQAIIATGNIGKRASPANLSSESSYLDRQKQTVFEIGRFCFKSSDSYEDVSGKAGLLLVDQFSKASVGVITESISSIKICPLLIS